MEPRLPLQSSLRLLLPVTARTMEIGQVLRWIVIAIVIIILAIIVDAILGLLGFLFKLALPVLVILLVVAIILCFIGMLKTRR